MKWAPAIIDDVIYDLSHLHPFDFTLELPPRGVLPPLTIYIHVSFSLHCFTRKLDAKTGLTHCYADARETRKFCLDRYAMSRRLPEIVRTLDRRRCYDAQYNNYMSFEILDRNGRPRHYQMDFKLGVAEGANNLHLFVQSAFEREHPSQLQRVKPRLFKSLCAETLRQKK